MCVAGLNVSTQSCNHRWYQLLKPCNPGNNLANCPQKLRLEGWESKVDGCPFCNGGEYDTSTHKLFGSMSSASSVASSPTISEMGMTPANRRGSCGTIDNNGTLTPLDRQLSISSMEMDRSQRARDMNQRIHLYLASAHFDTLPSARKNVPTYAAAIARVDSASSSRKDSSGDTSGPPRLRRSDSISSITRGWKKRVSGKFSTSLFKIV